MARSITETIVTRMMQRDIDGVTGGDLMDLAIAVEARVLCSCGKSLDFHQSVITRIGERVVFVQCGDCFDSTKEGLSEIAVNVGKEHGYKGSLGFVDGRDYTKDFKKKTPPVKPKTNRKKLTANIRLKASPNDLTPVVYSKRFEGSGFTWFIHREDKKDYWTVSNWGCGFSLGFFRTQKEGIERARSLTQEEIEIVKGSISLHGGANPPAEKGGKA